jgi:hypothetical protein
MGLATRLALAILVLASGSVQASEGGAPLPPTMVTAQATGPGILVSWQPPLEDGGSPVESYRVLRLDDLGWSIRASIPADSTVYLDSDASPFAVYRVEAVNAVGPGIPSEPTSALMKLGGIGNALTDPKILVDPCPLLGIGGSKPPFIDINSNCLDGILHL